MIVYDCWTPFVVVGMENESLTVIQMAAISKLLLSPPVSTLWYIMTMPLEPCVILVILWILEWYISVSNEIWSYPL